MIRTATITLLALLAAAPVGAQTMTITRQVSRAVRPAPAAHFTGEARVDRLFEGLGPSAVSGGAVTFEPGARTAWHVHPGGQILTVTDGLGLVQEWGGPIEEIRPGDVVHIPAGVKHWHGASPGDAMTHLALMTPRDGTAVEWMEAVTDEQYRGSTARAEDRGTRQAADPDSSQGARRPSGPLQQTLAPGLARLTDDVLYGDVWRRGDLSPRDRSLVTISILIATGKTAQLTGHLTRALANGLLPSEASGVLAQLAIYAGWPNAVSALPIYQEVYAARHVDTAPLHAAAPLLPTPTSPPARALDGDLAGVAPKFAELTRDVVFDDLWRRPDLAPRDRSLVTIAALAAMGDDDELDAYVRRGLDSGLTREEIAEALTHLGFYAGWGRAASAIRAAAPALGR
jgi:4-carboxymuconolactone decarboxylase